MTTRRERLLIEEGIKAASLDVSIDETVKSVCPFCEAEHEHSFDITRNEQGLLYNCHRASCGAHGFISSMVGTIPQETKDVKYKKFQPKEYNKPLEEVPDVILQMLYDKYELTKEVVNEQQFKYNREENRLVMPVFDYRGGTYGAVAKSLTTGVKGFKTINYFHRETSRLHYPRQRHERGGAIAVVEDILSASKVSTLHKSVALLGHTLSIEQIKELRSQTEHLILMLDPDVFHKALTYKKRFGFYFRNFSVVLLSKDPKDTPKEELQEIINDTCNS